MTKYELTLNDEQLVLLEIALRAYDPDNLSDHGKDVLDDLKSDVYAARRRAHQASKSQQPAGAADDD